MIMTTDPTVGNGGNASSSTTPSIPTLEELKSTIVALAALLKEKYGERAAVLIAVGIPRDGVHDRYASFVTGPCLAERGLLGWATESWMEQIRAHQTAE